MFELCKKTRQTIQRAERLRDYRLVACDITENCNLRCIFCFNQFHDRNVNMTEPVLRQMLQVLPYTKNASFEDGTGFYFSCLWEPSIHPHFIELLETLPAQGKDKIFFTTNLAKKQETAFFERLGACNLHHINISVETLEKERYTALTGGGAHLFDSFVSNLQTMAAVFSGKDNVPGLRYITMAVRRNQDEIPSIVERCYQTYGAAVCEVRSPFVGKYLSRIKDELLSEDDIALLHQKLSALPYDTQQAFVHQEHERAPEKEDGAGSEKEQGLLYRAPKEDYYDIRIDAAGNIKWRGDGFSFPYQEDADYAGVFERQLSNLARAEAQRGIKDGGAYVAQLRGVGSRRQRSRFFIDRMDCDDSLAEIRGWAGFDDIDSRDFQPVMVLYRKKNYADAVLYSCRVREREDVANMFGDTYRASGFLVLLQKEDLTAEGVTGRLFWVSKSTGMFEAKMSQSFLVKGDLLEIRNY